MTKARYSSAPGITVRNAKLFLDGVIAAPAFTGAMREPYFVNSRGGREAGLGARSLTRARRVLSR